MLRFFQQGSLKCLIRGDETNKPPFARGTPDRHLRATQQESQIIDVLRSKAIQQPSLPRRSKERKGTKPSTGHPNRRR